MNNAVKILFFKTFFFLFLVSFTSSAQNYPVLDLEEILSAENNNTSLSNAEVEEITSLIYDLQPTVYINNSEIKVYNDKPPVKAEFVSTSYQVLENPNPLFNSVELLKIKLAEAGQFNSTINLSDLESFQNLKYVFVECSFNCGKSKIEEMFSNMGNIIVLYLIATPE